MEPLEHDVYFEALEDSYGGLPVEVPESIADKIDNAQEVEDAFELIGEHYRTVAGLLKKEQKYG